MIANGARKSSLCRNWISAVRQLPGAATPVPFVLIAVFGPAQFYCEFSAPGPVVEILRPYPAMAPIAGKTPLQRAARLRAVANKLKQKAKLVRVTDLLKSNDQALDRVEEMLIDESFLEREEVVQSTAVRKRQAAQTLALEDGPGHGGGSDGGASTGDSSTSLSAMGTDLTKYTVATYNRNKSAISDVPVEVLISILNDMDDIAYSAANVKSGLTPKGKKHVCKDRNPAKP